VFPIQVQEAFRTQTDMTKIEPLYNILLLKTISTENKGKNIEGYKREKSKKHIKVNPSK
jgi:hypothetical protein